MEKLKKIVFVTCASNFERHKNFITAIHKKLTEMGGYVFYVLTCYGVFTKQNEFRHGESAIYSFLDFMDIDGCIIEANLGSAYIMNYVCEKLEKRKIPTISVNIEKEGIPYITMDGYASGRKLVEHMVDVHHCRRVNLILNEKENDVLSANLLRACKDVFRERNLEFDEARIYRQTVGIPSGRQLFHQFEKDGTNDADVMVFIHDVLAIGYELEMEKHQKRVPDDTLICSLNRSANSLVFRPDITGVDRADAKVATLACELLSKMMAGEHVPVENYYSGEVSFGASCGCDNSQGHAVDQVYQQMVLSKVSAGEQIRSMMEFNGELEDVDTLEQLAENIKKMMQGVGIGSFFCCINRDDEEFILNQAGDMKNSESAPYDDTMLVITGMSERTGEIKRREFSLSELVPAEPKEGDMFLFFPIHHEKRDYGYMVFLNESLPVEVYNYRICHESLGISIESLHKQMVLKQSIAELDKLHMVDQMTGLYNRFAISRFKKEYISKGKYAVAMIDMDGLKKINDNYGHLAGNNAICTTANGIRKTLSEDDLIVRYGGDEFVVLSRNTDPEFWKQMRSVINTRLQKSVDRQKLPYQVGVSIGFTVVDRSVEKVDFDMALEAADREMYEDKKNRKAGRE